MTPLAFSAVLLAAGRSRRMGRDKALLEVDGEPLWQRQRQVLGDAGATEIFISARPEQTWVPKDARVVRDEEADLGPLGGIVAALEKTEHSHLAVLAVDLPRMNVAWFRKLARECAPAQGVVGRREGFFEPLAAIYPRALLPRARAAAAGRKLSLQHLLTDAISADEMRAVEISAQEAVWFENLNSPPETASPQL